MLPETYIQKFYERLDVRAVKAFAFAATPATSLYLESAGLS
jgi:hypothetical protein